MLLLRMLNKTWRNNKKHPENADTSTSVTFDLDVWIWPYLKVKKAYVIRFSLLYYTFEPGMMSVSVIVCKIKAIVHFCDLWPSSVTFIVCQDHFNLNHQMDVMLLCIGTKYEVCMFNRIWDINNCLEKTLNDVTMTSSSVWFYKFQTQIYQGHI